MTTHLQVECHVRRRGAVAVRPALLAHVELLVAVQQDQTHLGPQLLASPSLIAHEHRIQQSASAATKKATGRAHGVYGCT